MSIILAAILVFAGVAIGHPVNISLYIADSTGAGIKLDSDDVNIRLFDKRTNGFKIHEEVKKIKTANGVVQTRIGEAIDLPDNIPDSMFLEIEYRGKILPRYRIGAVVYAIKAKNAKRIGGLDTSQIAYRNHTHDSASFGNITFVDSTVTAINALKLQNLGLSDLDGRFAAKMHSHTSTNTITRIDSSGHADVADSAGRAGNTRLFNGLPVTAFSSVTHNHDGVYSGINHTHGATGQILQKVDSSTYSDTAKYTARARRADTAAIAQGIIGKAGQAIYGDTATYALSVRPFKQDSAKYADTARIALSFLGKAGSAVYSDTATVALKAVAGFKADSAGYADSAAYAVKVSGKIDSATYGDTALFAYRTKQTKIDSARYADTAQISRKTLQRRVDSSAYADTASYARNYLFKKVDSAVYADTARYTATGRRADTATYFGNKKITDFALVGHLHPQDTMDLKGRGFVSVCSLGCDYGLIDDAVTFANSKNPTEASPMVVYVKTTKSNKMTISSNDFVYFKGENPGIEIELQGTAKFNKAVICDMVVKSNHSISNVGNMAWELRNCRFDIGGGAFSLDTLVCINTEIYTTTTTANLSGDYLRVMSCRFNNRGGGSPALSMNWSKGIFMGCDFDLPVTSTGTGDHIMNCRFNAGDFVAPNGGIIQSCWINSIKTKVAAKYFNNIILTSACNTGESGSPAVWVGNINSLGVAIGVPSCP